MVSGRKEQKNDEKYVTCNTIAFFICNSYYDDDGSQGV